MSDGAAGPAPRASRRIAAEAWDAADAARRAAASAVAEAGAVVAAARGEADAIRRAAAEAGRAEGLASVTALAVAAARARDRALEAAETTVVELALDLARRVLERCALRDAEAVVDTARAALLVARGRGAVTVRVHPDDVSALRSAQPALAEALGGGGLALRADPAVARGGAVVETEAGSVDATLDAQLAALREALGLPPPEAG